jgi:hypothetical protein
MTAWEEIRWKSVGVLGRFVLRICAQTSRIKVTGEEGYRKAKDEGRPIILLIWHGRLMLVPYFFRKRRIMGLVSPSKDGEIIAQIAIGWGFRIIRGSSSHSIVRAWVEMKKELLRGGELIIIPDGPRGPDRVLKAGCLKLAQETGAVLVPFSYSASRKRFLKSWDRLLLFYPFSSILAVYGQPMTVKPGLDEQAFELERQCVEKALTNLGVAADAHFETPGMPF